MLHRRERHTLMAALQHWRRGHLWTEREMAIASDCGQQPILNPQEIDDLYAKLREEA